MAIEKNDKNDKSGGEKASDKSAADLAAAATSLEQTASALAGAVDKLAGNTGPVGRASMSDEEMAAVSRAEAARHARSDAPKAETRTVRALCARPHYRAGKFWPSSSEMVEVDGEHVQRGPIEHELDEIAFKVLKRDREIVIIDVR